MDGRRGRPPSTRTSAWTSSSTAARCRGPGRGSVRRRGAGRSLDTDITTLAVDAIANAANTHLLHGGGVAGAIARAAGPALNEESRRRAPIGLGEAVGRRGGELPARWVIHAATMVDPGGRGVGRRRAPRDAPRRCGRRRSSAPARSPLSPSAPASAASRSRRLPRSRWRRSAATSLPARGWSASCSPSAAMRRARPSSGRSAASA